MHIADALSRAYLMTTDGEQTDCCVVQFWPPLSVVTLRSRRERVQGHLSGHARAKPIRADQSAGC